MKTAQEWQNMWTHDTGPCPAIDQIQAIQADAYRAGLLRAAQVCRDEASTLAPLGFGHKCLSDAAKAIEAEAQKGQP